MDKYAKSFFAALRNKSAVEITAILRQDIDCRLTRAFEAMAKYNELEDIHMFFFQTDERPTRAYLETAYENMYETSVGSAPRCYKELFAAIINQSSKFCYEEHFVVRAVVDWAENQNQEDQIQVSEDHVFCISETIEVELNTIDWTVECPDLPLSRAPYTMKVKPVAQFNKQARCPCGKLRLTAFPCEHVKEETEDGFKRAFYYKDLRRQGTKLEVNINQEPVPIIYIPEIEETVEEVDYTYKPPRRFIRAVEFQPKRIISWKPKQRLSRKALSESRKKELKARLNVIKDQKRFRRALKYECRAQSGGDETIVDAYAKIFKGSYTDINERIEIFVEEAKVIIKKEQSIMAVLAQNSEELFSNHHYALLTELLEYLEYTTDLDLSARAIIDHYFGEGDEFYATIRGIKTQTFGDICNYMSRKYRAIRSACLFTQQVGDPDVVSDWITTLVDSVTRKLSMQHQWSVDFIDTTMVRMAIRILFDTVSIFYFKTKEYAINTILRIILEKLPLGVCTRALDSVFEQLSACWDMLTQPAPQALGDWVEGMRFYNAIVGTVGLIFFGMAAPQLSQLVATKEKGDMARNFVNLRQGSKALKEWIEECKDLILYVMNDIFELNCKPAFLMSRIQTFKEEVKTLVNDVNAFTMPVSNLGIYVSNEYRVRAAELSTRCVKLLNECNMNFNDAGLRALLFDLQKKLEIAAKASRNILDSVSKRVDPFCLALASEPGIGKSTMLIHIADALAKIAEYPEGNLTYTRPNPTDRDDSYWAQLITILDDFGQEREKHEDVNFFMVAKSAAPLTVQKASLEDKGAQFRSEIIILATNTAYPTFPSVASEQALYRRRNVLVEVVLAKDYEKFKTPTGIDFTSMQPTSFEYMRFNILNPLANSAHIRSNLTYDEMMLYVSEKFETYMDAQVQLLANSPPHVGKIIIPAYKIKSNYQKFGLASCDTFEPAKTQARLNDNLPYQDVSMSFEEHLFGEIFRSENCLKSFNDPTSSIDSKLEHIAEEKFFKSEQVKGVIVDMGEYKIDLVHFNDTTLSWTPVYKVWRLIDEGMDPAIARMIRIASADQVRYAVLTYLELCSTTRTVVYDFEPLERQIETEVRRHPWYKTFKIAIALLAIGATAFGVYKVISKFISMYNGEVIEAESGETRTPKFKINKSRIESGETRTPKFKVNMARVQVKADGHTTELKYDEDVLRTVVIGLMQYEESPLTATYDKDNKLVHVTLDYDDYNSMVCALRSLLDKNEPLQPEDEHMIEYLTMIKLDLFKDKEEWERLGYKAWAQGAYDPNCLDLMHKFKKNVVTVGQNKGEVKTHAFCIGGNYYLINLHFALMLKDQQLLYIRDQGIDFPVFFSVNDLKFFPTKNVEGESIDRDMCIWQIGGPSSRLESKSLAIEYFLKESDITNVYKCPATVLSKRKDETLFHTAPTTKEFTCSYADHKGSTYKLHKGLRYDISTVEGDCGSPVFIHNPKINGRKIYGIHAAGGFGYGAAVPITQELLMHVMSGVKIQCQGREYGPLNVDKTQPPEVAKLDVPPKSWFLGIANKEDVVFQPSTHDIKKSLIVGTLGEPTTAPAVLTANDPRMDPGTPSPLQQAVEKESTQLPPFPRVWSDAYEEGRLNDFKVKLQDKGKPVALTTHEVLNGFGCLDSMNMSTSDGHPLVHTNVKGLRAKKKWVEFDDDTQTYKLRPNTEFTEMLEYEERCYRSGLVPVDASNIYCVKSERRAHAKIKAGKSRIFTICSFSNTFLVRKYFGGFIEAIMSVHLDVNHGIGTNAHGADWTELANKFDEFRVEGNSVINQEWYDSLSEEDKQQVKDIKLAIIALDHKEFDSKQQAETLRGHTTIVNQWYDYEAKRLGLEIDPMDAVARSTLTEGAIYKIMRVLNVVMMSLTALPSGFGLTTIYNSETNNKYMFMAWMHTMTEKAPELATYQAYRKFCYFNFYGDDLVGAIKLQLIHLYNARSIHQALLYYGYETTSSQKLKNIEIVEKLTDITYLKRRFERHPKATEVYMAPLEWSMIVEMTNWIRKSPSDKQATFDNCQTALREAYYHGEQKFKETREKIEAALAAQDALIEPLYTYRDLEVEYLHNVT